MARYDSNQVNQTGQYPAPSFTGYGLPAQSQGSGAPGGGQFAGNRDPGGTNQPGQYPGRSEFTGSALDGTGAPGSAGVGAPTGGAYSTVGGGDTAVYTEFDAGYKGERDSNGMVQGSLSSSASSSVAGKGDWTQANGQGYQAADNLQMPGVAGNTPAPGDGHFQTGRGRVLRGGFMNGQR